MGVLVAVTVNMRYTRFTVLGVVCPVSKKAQSKSFKGIFGSRPSGVRSFKAQKVDLPGTPSSLVLPAQHTIDTACGQQLGLGVVHAFRKSYRVRYAIIIHPTSCTVLLYLSSCIGAVGEAGTTLRRYVS